MSESIQNAMVWRAGTDKHGEFISAGALKAAVAEYATRLPLPISLDFDDRLPPVGLVNAARFEGGAFIVDGLLWEPTIPQPGEHLRPAISVYDSDVEKRDGGRMIWKCEISGVSLCAALTPTPLPPLETN